MFEGNLFMGSRIRLTAVRPDDALMFAHWYDDSEFARLYDFRPAHPRTPMRMRSVLDDGERSSEGFMFALRLHYSDDIIGIVNLEDIAWNHRSGWLGIAIGDPAHRGQGYGQEAIEMVLRFAFHEINLHRIQLTVFAYNTRAIALYERLHFTREGVWREALRRDGQWHDILFYSLLAHEWEAHQGSPAAESGD